MNQMRRNPEQDPSFATCFEDESEMAVLQVAQSTVYQTGRLGAGARREVTHVNYSGSDPTHRGVPGNSRSGHTRANNEQVQRLSGHDCQILGSRFMRERGNH
jgi:hypothetical protein